MTNRAHFFALSALVALELTAPTPAMAATGDQTFTVVIQGKLSDGNATPTRAVVVANGVINAVGSDQFLPSQPGDPPNVDRDLFTFPNGTLTIKVTNVTFSGGPPDPRSCVAQFAQTGTWDVIGGTGAYARASGGATFSLRGTGVAARLPGGGCADDATFVIVDRAAGDLVLPSDGANL